MTSKLCQTSVGASGMRSQLTFLKKKIRGSSHFNMGRQSLRMNAVTVFMRATGSSRGGPGPQQARPT